MAGVDLRVDDLVLFYLGDDKQLKSCALTNELLNNPDVSVNVDPSWFSAVLLDKKLQAGGNYYVANLSLLLPPQQPGAQPPPRAPQALPPPPDAQRVAGDVVVIPFNPANPNKAAVIPRSYYSQQPEIEHDDIPDLVYMANEEGVTIANLPKFDLPGISCGLLNLLSLRSGSVPMVAVETENDALKAADGAAEAAMVSKTRRALANGDARYAHLCESVRPRDWLRLR